MSRTSALLAAFALTFSLLPAFADTVPYSHPGTIAAQTTLTATTTGDVMGYFVQGGAASQGSAGDTDVIRLYDVTAGTFSAYMFQNQTTAAGATADFGHVAAGDVLVFELLNQSTGQLFATTAAQSEDSVNHGYVTAYAGGTLNGANFPAGTYVGMEDLDKSVSDFNYRDDTFVFTNVAVAATPEPGSLLLLGTGMLGLAGGLRRRLTR